MSLLRSCTELLRSDTGFHGGVGVSKLQSILGASGMVCGHLSMILESGMTAGGSMC